MLLLVSHPSLVAEAREYIQPDTLTDPASTVLYSVILRAYERDPSLATLLEDAGDDQLKRAVAELAASQVPFADPNEELAHTVVELQKKFIRSRLRDITRRLRQTPGDRALLREQQDMSQKLLELTSGTP